MLSLILIAAATLIVACVTVHAERWYWLAVDARERHQEWLDSAD